MKLKTFILTFLLMMMSGPMIFGQNRTVTAEVRSFAELDEAIKSASEDPDLTANILLKRDIEYTKRIVIPTGVKVYIDINGFNLTCTNDYAFQNEGDLTIEDNGNYDSQYGWSVARIKSTGIMNAYTGTGKLLLNNVIVENNSGSGVVINNKVGGNVEIINGEIIAKGGANSVQNDGFMKMDGTIVKTEYRSFVISKQSQLTLDDTKIYDPNGGYRYDAKFLSAAEINALNNPNNDPNIPNVITETGETFFVKANVGSIPYPSLEAAVNFAQNNNAKVIDLLYNDVLNNTIEIADNVEEIIINGNGNTLTVAENMPLLSNFSVKIGFSVRADKTTINDLNVESEDCHVFYFRPDVTEATINNCNIKGWSAVYVSDNNATININESNLVGENVREDVHANSFATIALNTQADGVKINMNGGSVTAKSNDKAIQFVIANSETDNSLANSEFIIDAEIITEGNNAKYIGLDGDNKSPKAQVRAEYADELFAEGWATSEVEDTDMISVDGIAVAMIDGETYGSIAEAYMAVTNGKTIEILTDDNTIGSATVLNYPVNGDTEYATEFTITTKEGYEFAAEKSGFKFIFNNVVNVTFENADINAILSPNNSTVTLAGNNDIKGTSIN